MVWLQKDLRISDNPALCKACELADRVAIVYVWRHAAADATNSAGRGYTAGAAFEAQAVAALDWELRGRGNHLTVLVLPGASDASAAAAVAELAANVGATVVAEAPDSNRMLTLAAAMSAVGRSRAGGGGRVLRWAAFLAASMHLQPEVPQPAPTHVPPPPDGILNFGFKEGAACLVVPPHWMLRMLASWGEVSERAARRLAVEAGHAATVSKTIGEAAAVEAENGIARPSRLSPFLRFGVISAREAAALGVRRRDLLWRDWSHLCWSLVTPLRCGEPVVAPLDGCCLRSRNPGSSTDEQAGISGGRMAAHLASFDEKAAFEAWCVGATGAPIVDAGMRQLWVEGWMPRRVRLLCACCLTEGMGLDWRLGRDWFARTLIDHDPAINEMMWQNSGLVGIDPFYVSLKWEEHEGQEQDDAGSMEPNEASEGSNAVAPPCSDWAWAPYTRRWRTEEMRWPPHLRFAASQPPPPVAQVVAAAVARRHALRLEYKSCGLVGRAGVRVDHSLSPGAQSTGKVIGIGKVSLQAIAERYQKAKSVQQL